MPVDLEAVQGDIRRAFTEITGHSMSELTDFSMSGIPGGGMSGSMIHVETWREKLLPMLLERAEQHFDAFRDRAVLDSG